MTKVNLVISGNKTVLVKAEMNYRHSAKGARGIEYTASCNSKKEIDSAIVELRPIAEGSTPNSQLNTQQEANELCD